MYYVCSDIHGQGVLYDRMMADLNLQENDTLFVLGDVIDRGPDGIRILQDIMKRENVVMFLGNHELMMLDYFSDDGFDSDAWYYACNGGRVTDAQFQLLPESEQNAILSFLSDAWIQKYIEADGERYALHHSFFLPDRKGEDVRYSDINTGPSCQTGAFEAVWNSPYRIYENVPLSAYDDGYIHIAGHIPVQRLGCIQPPHVDGPLTDIDGGCARLMHGGSGGLFCMSLDRGKDGERKQFWYPGEPQSPHKSVSLLQKIVTLFT